MHPSSPHARSSPRTTTTTTTATTTTSATSSAATAAAASARDSGSPKAKRKAGVKRESAYTAFMAHELKRVKAQHPEMRHQDVFKLAAANWRYHPTNSKRIAATATATAATAQSSSAGTAQAPANHGGTDHRQPDGHRQEGDGGQDKDEHDTGSMGDEEL
ncbi:hypothetical protein AMAG_02504 [Allomyces macrogynus ATCC 38327]|uniref:YABBY protein C-terminal domain-containing protein n=1 Tax=Allomyces macrogynus (strain ATCC 38327) TaxID=578462 RepID=A0A0L0S2U4_ALLM3|nr:hypothetical protein AMAG_02504 [Allomyces macrogynus ATCC 38327]|eukprot:KNE56725.1 hypothetical protein AMAG_02504 [Allomyces macrogynus ATCC 38327]